MKSPCFPVFALLSLALGACSLGRSSPSGESRIERAGGANDPAIEAELVVLCPQIVQEGEGRRVELDLRNDGSKRIEFVFTVDWFDKAARPVPLSSTGWIRLSLESGAVQPLRIAPMPAEACSWRLRFLPTDHGRG